ncbi:conserved domain protein, partial [Acinetobacter baumannii 6013150]
FKFVYTIMYHKIVSLNMIGVIFSQNYWQNIPKLLIKKPTCFKIGFSLVFGFF